MSKEILLFFVGALIGLFSSIVGALFQFYLQLAELHKYTMPWHCIVCCTGHVCGGPEGPGTRAFGISHVLRRKRSEEEPPEHSDKQDEYPQFSMPRIVEQLPERISILRQHALSHERIRPELIFKLFGETPPKQVILHGITEEE